MKPWMRWTFIAFVLYMIVANPDQSAQILDNSVDLVGRLFQGSASFVDRILS